MTLKITSMDSPSNDPRKVTPIVIPTRRHKVHVPFPQLDEHIPLNTSLVRNVNKLAKMQQPKRLVITACWNRLF